MILWYSSIAVLWYYCITVLWVLQYCGYCRIAVLWYCGIAVLWYWYCNCQGQGAHISEMHLRSDAAAAKKLWKGKLSSKLWSIGAHFSYIHMIYFCIQFNISVFYLIFLYLYLIFLYSIQYFCIHPTTRIPNSSVRPSRKMCPSVTKKPGCRGPSFPKVEAFWALFDRVPLVQRP